LRGSPKPVHDWTRVRRLGITEAFTNDKHFQAAGFTLLF
jgi:hypothetical protein